MKYRKLTGHEINEFVNKIISIHDENINPLLIAEFMGITTDNLRKQIYMGYMPVKKFQSTKSGRPYVCTKKMLKEYLQNWYVNEETNELKFRPLRNR